MTESKLFKILKGPYQIIGKSGEAYDVNDISDLFIAFGGNFSKFFTFNISDFETSQLIKPDGFNQYAYDNCTYFLKRLSHDFLENNNYSSKEMDAIKAISTDLLTHMNRISCQGESEGFKTKHYCSERYFFIKHKHYYNEVSSIDNEILYNLISRVARNNEKSFSFFYNKVLFNYSIFASNGSKRSNYRNFRLLHNTPERRWNDAHVKEHGFQIVRGKRRNLPDTWDDYCRQYNRCWKQKKVKKQWMKRLNRHQDTVILKSLESNETLLHDLLV